MGIVAYTGKPAAPNPPVKVNLHRVNSKSARHLPAPQKKPYIYKKTPGTVGTVGTVGTAPASPVVIGFVGTHTQIFTCLPLVTALPFRA